MSFAHPAFLWLLVLPVLVALWHWRTRTALMSRGRALVVGGVRVVALMLLVLALAGPFREQHASRDALAVVLDVSDSVDAASLHTALQTAEELRRSAGDDPFYLVTCAATARSIDLDNTDLTDTALWQRLRPVFLGCLGVGRRPASGRQSAS